MKQIDFEAHYFAPEFLNSLAQRREYPIYYPERKEIAFGEDFKLKSEFKVNHLTESFQERIATMDRYGITAQMLSVTYSVEQLPVSESIVAARQNNNYVFSGMQQYPGRFVGLASLPVYDADASVEELERCIKELGFFGWNAFSNFGDAYPDDERFFPIFAKAAELDVPIYLHPSLPFDSRLTGLGAQLSAASFGYAIDTSISLMRLILKGLFDQFPNLKIIIGHLGEVFPFLLNRIDEKGATYNRAPAVNKELPGYYFKNNIWITTSGQFSPEAFQCAKSIVGIDHILMGSDYPYEQLDQVHDFLYRLPLSDEEKEKLYYRNAQEYFHLTV